jgi:hypothetical protein
MHAGQLAKNFALNAHTGATLSRFLLLLLASLLSFPAFAQNQYSPTIEVFGGGSYVRTDNSPNVNAYGWEASATEYPYESYRWIGGTVEANGVYASPDVKLGNQTLGGLLNANIYTYMAGPSVVLHTRRAMEPFAHVLLGAVIRNVNTTGKGEAILGTSVSQSDTVFGYALGGGLDVPITARVATRGQADWLRSSFKDSAADRQDNLRVSVGIVLKF